MKFREAERRIGASVAARRRPIITIIVNYKNVVIPRKLHSQINRAVVSGSRARVSERLSVKRWCTYTREEKGKGTKRKGKERKGKERKGGLNEVYLFGRDNRKSWQRDTDERRMNSRSRSRLLGLV